MADLLAIEQKWQKKWLDEKIFEPNVDKKKKKYFVAIPYPYTNAPFHIGHGRTYATSDIFARYRRMSGLNVIWPMAYHVTGTPVLATSAKIESGDEDTKKLFREYIKLHTKNDKKVEEILKSFVNPEAVMSYFSKTFYADFNSLGCSIDWRRQFTTNDKDYNKFIEWQFKTLHKMGYIKKGEFPVLFCQRCGNAVGVDDIKNGDQIKPEVQEWYLWKFPYEDGFIVCATLRPETIYGVTNLWINPDGNYAKVQVDNEIWYIGQKAAEKLRTQKAKVFVKDVFLGKEIVGENCKSPVTGKKIPIFVGTFVEPQAGSGIVYSVPAHAPFDYAALKDVQRKGIAADIEPIVIIKVEGYSEAPAVEAYNKYGIKSQNELEKLNKATEEVYKAEFYSGTLNERCGKFAGKKILEVKDAVVEHFVKEKVLDKLYEVNALEKPVKCRCGEEVTVSVLKDQWFIDYGNKEWKEKARKCLRQMEIVPESSRKLFEDTIEWLHEKPVARKRGLGTKLPMDPSWIIESLSDSTIYMAFYTVVNHIRNNGLKPEQLTENFWNYVLLSKGKETDVEKETGIPKKLLLKMKEEFEYWYPVDLRHTGNAHLSNHLTFYIFNHAAIFPEKHWPRTISMLDMLIKDGKKMSKSLGNVIPLAEVPQRYTTDLFRLYIAYGADLSSVMDFKEADVLALKSKIHQFFNLVISAKKGKTVKPCSINKWIVSRFNTNVLEATKAIESYNPRLYVQHAFFNVLNDVLYYQRRHTDETLLVKEIFPEWVKLLAPVMPHLSEELWEHLGGKGFVSLASWPKSDKKRIDSTIEASEELVSNTTADISEIIKLVGHAAQKITIFVADEWKSKLMAVVADMVEKGKRDFREIMTELMKDEAMKKHAEDIAKIIPRLLRDVKKINANAMGAKKEKELLEEAKEFLKEEFKAKIEIAAEHESREQKARQAMPGKPALLIS
ncbi:MAG: leucine--tRNA ligase [Candidatus Nanoarchaeia archaeon]|nr:leucine--tRNA ligase [Candidatus Nanoarchaeia archaeon]